MKSSGGTPSPTFHHLPSPLHLPSPHPRDDPLESSTRELLSPPPPPPHPLPPLPPSPHHHHHSPLHLPSPHPRDDPLESSTRELLSHPLPLPLPPLPPSPHHHHHSPDVTTSSSWRLNINEFRLPPQTQSHTYLRRLCPEKNQGKIAEYYKQQERLLEGFNEMETITESGCLPGSMSENEIKQLARSERMAIHFSNVANMVLFIAKVYASVESRSLAVIASTLDSFLDLLSGFILWFTSNAMRTPNQYRYPIGKKRMQPVGIIVFASVMATLGLQILLESVRELLSKSRPELDREKEKWMIGIMVSVTVVKFVLMVYCRRFKNEIVRAYAQDHFFDVITNSVGLVTAVLAVRFYWWIDPTGAILIAVYTMKTWARTVIENVGSLIGRTAPPEFLAKLTYLIWNHHEEIKQIDTVRAYTLGANYFVEVDIVLAEEMPLGQAHNIGESLQEKLEQLPDVDRAFVHIDFEFTHAPEHKPKL